MAREPFRSVSYDYRLYSGHRSLELHLRREVERANAHRVLVVCSPSVARRTTVIARIAGILQDRHAGTFDEVEKDSTFASVLAAQHVADQADADMLVAVGGGGVMVAARAVAIFLAEKGDPLELMTQYPEDRPAYSPRLIARKLPIINVPTTPSTAMNRSGTGLRHDGLVHRMEFFDPKTRPQAMFWDSEALASTPFEVFRSTATTVFARAFGSVVDEDDNPLADGDRRQAFRLAHEAFLLLSDGHDSDDVRIKLCAAALLQNRAEDDGRGSHAWTSAGFGGDYAISTALHVMFQHVGQGEATSALTSAAIRMSGESDARAARRAARVLGVWRQGMTEHQARSAVADDIDAIYTRIGMPTRVRQLGITEDDLIAVAEATVKNFNANAGARDPAGQVASSLRVLRAAW